MRSLKLEPAIVLTVLAMAAAGCGAKDDAPGAGSASSKLVLKVGHFPNVTHAQALVAHALSRQGKGWFEERLGPNVEVQWFVYNAGPAAMEAIINGSIDLTYVGPNPALNAYMKSDGRYVRIIAGSALGGAALVVPGDGRIRAPADFRGKRVGTPALGNTQDVACRAWLKAQGFTVTQLGGEVIVVPTENPNQLALFQKGDLDAVWTVEPWVSRLELEAKGVVLLEEGDALTTVLAASERFLSEKQELARKFAAAHGELTRWVQENTAEAQRLVRDELKAETTREISAELLTGSWKRLKFTSEIDRSSLEKFVIAAKSVGFLQDLVDMARLVEVPK